MKQHLKLLLTALFLTFSFATSAQTSFTSGYAKFTTISGTTDEVTLEGFTNDAANSGSINIPASITYSGKKFRITEIGERAFWKKTQITQVTVAGAELRTIGSGAFEGCTGLISFVVPEANVLTNIGDLAFYGCTALRAFMSSSNQFNVTTIGESAFNGCCNLSTEINMMRLKSIGVNAFRGCSSLTQVTNLGHVTEIPYGAFNNCTSLAPVPLNGVTSIGQYAFYGINSTTSSVWDITIGSTCRIDDYAFYGYKGTMNITGSYNPYSTLYIDSWSNKAHTIVFDRVRYEFTERAFRYNAPDSGERSITLKNSYVTGVINDPSLKTLTMQNTGGGAFIDGNITTLNVLDKYCSVGGFARDYLTSGFTPNATEEVLNSLKTNGTAWSMLLTYPELTADSRELKEVKRDLEEAQTELGKKDLEIEEYKEQLLNNSSASTQVMTYLADIASMGQPLGDVNGDSRVSIGDVTFLVDILSGKSTIKETAQYVDLGLPSGTKWATTNLGAALPCDNGDFYAWGEITPKDVYIDANYSWYDANSQPTKYTEQDQRTSLDPADDAATVVLGPNWKTPSVEQLQELLDECTFEHVAALNAYVFTGPNGNRLYMPLAGFKNNAHQMDENAFYMSCDIYDVSTRKQCNVLLLDTYSGDSVAQFVRRNGLSVRPVYVGQ